ncbi:MAG TPA: SRPBCC domain-containing protein [Acidimicrobiales bacterium]|jgi:uncharacterized protein YndB with AHSA1/START domain
MVRRQIEVPVSPARLWELVADPASVSSWFGAAVDWDLVPGAPARFAGGEDGDRAGRIETVVPGRHLRFRWWPEDDAEACSEVALVVEPVGEGARLTVTERPVGTGGAAVPEAEACAGAWSTWDSRFAGAWCRLALVDAPVLR